MVLAGAAPAVAATINVPADYGTIQAAVTAAVANDTISVTGGPYTENVSINNTGHVRDGVTVQGAGVTINGGFLILNAANVTVSGFRINGGYPYGSHMAGVAVQAVGASILGCIIENVIGNQSRAIETAYNADDLLVEGCQILSSNLNGPYINPSSGVTLRGNYFEKGPGGDGWTNFLAEHNVFNGVNVGVSTVGPNVALHDNDFVNNNGSRAVTWYGGEVIDATNNWWGSVNGPTDTIGTLEVPENPGASLADMLNAAPAGALGAGADDNGGGAPYGGSNVAYYPWRGAPANLNLAVADVSGGIGQSVDLEATLTDGGTPVAVKSIEFWLDGTPIAGSPVNTESNGVATLPYTVAVALGDHLITARFAGDALFMPAVGYGKLTVPQPSVVWVDDDYTAGGANDGHTWGYDAFAVIQQGVNAVAAGGTVNVAAGNYGLAGMGGPVWEPVAIDKSLSLIGAGSTQTILDATGYTGHCDVVALRGSDVQLEGLGIRSGTFGIRVNGPAGQHDLALDDVAVSGVTSSGVVFDGTNGVTTVSLTDCSASGNGVGGDGRGIYVAPNKPVTDLSLTDTDCCNNSRDGLHVQGILTNLTIAGGSFNDNTGTASFYGSGITLEHTTTGTISGVEAKRNGSVYPSHGIYVKSASSNVAVSDCDLANERYGVLFIAVTDCSTEDNRIVDCDYGIADFSSVRSEHADNSITGTGLMGMQLRLAGDGVPGQWGVGDLDIGSSTFGSDLTEFIRLVTNGKVDVDATSATFQDAADDAAKEAKVWHDVDELGIGHVDWGQGAATATNLSVQNVSGAKGATVQLAARLTAGGAALAGQAVAISVDDVAVGAPVTDANGWARIDYTITQDAGGFNIDAAFRSVFNYQAAAGTGTLTVTTPAPTSITVTMAPNPVDAGATSTATVTGSNGVDYSAAATCYIQYGAGGSWAGNVYTSAKAGTWTVTAVYGSLAATTTLTVNHGAASSVTLAPITASITTDQTQTYTVQAADAQGNSWTPAAGEITWAENGAGGFTGMVYTPTLADGGNVVDITATVGGAVSNAAALTVISSGSGGTPLILAWDRDTATFYMCTDAANPQTGTALALGNNTVGTVTVTVTKTGSSSTDLVATVTNAGMPSNTLRVRWYLRSGAVDKCYYYSTISGVTHTAVYSLGRTSVDGGRSQVGFFGLAHNLNADPPTAISYSAVLQP